MRRPLQQSAAVEEKCVGYPRIYKQPADGNDLRLICLAEHRYNFEAHKCRHAFDLQGCFS